MPPPLSWVPPSAGASTSMVGMADAQWQVMAIPGSAAVATTQRAYLVTMVASIAAAEAVTQGQQLTASLQTLGVVLGQSMETTFPPPPPPMPIIPVLPPAVVSAWVPVVAGICAILGALVGAVAYVYHVRERSAKRKLEEAGPVNAVPAVPAVPVVNRALRLR